MLSQGKVRLHLWKEFKLSFYCMYKQFLRIYLDIPAPSRLSFSADSFPPFCLLQQLQRAHADMV